MHGIFLAIESNHLDTKNVQNAINGWNKLQPSASICNFYIREAIKDEEERAEYTPIEDQILAKKVVGHIIHTAIKANRPYFSLDAIDQFRKRASLETPITVAPVKIDLDKISQNTEIQFDIGEPTIIEQVVREQTVKPKKTVHPPVQKKVTTVKKTGSGRGRKYDANSAQHVAKRIYDEASDKNRDNILKLFADKLGLNPGTAMTYYYMARKAA